MTLYGSVGGSHAVRANEIYVDVGYTGSQENGSIAAPYTTIAAAIAAASAGDLIIISPGTYTEDLTLADGVDMMGAQPRAVSIVGSATMTDISLVLTDLDFVDDGAGTAFHFTGTAADTLTAIRCDFSATAGGGHALEIDNTAGTVVLDHCTCNVASGNANEGIRIEQGTVSMNDCDVVHEDNTSESLVLEGDAATTFLAERCDFVGQIGSEAAVANPTCTLKGCSVTVGADHAVLVAAGNTVTILETDITSSEAAQDAVGGAGTVVVGDVRFLSTADEYETTLTVSHAAGSLRQHGTVAAAGASPQTDAVTLPQVLPSANYDIQCTFEATGGGADDVICSVDQGTIATTGFTVVTTSAAGAAISGNVHWSVEHD